MKRVANGEAAAPGRRSRQDGTDQRQHAANARRVREKRRSQGATQACVGAAERRKDDDGSHDRDRRTNFLLNIGYGDTTKLYPRSPRLAFEEIARFA